MTREQQSDKERMDEALDAIAAVLRKRQMCLKHAPDCMVLGVRSLTGPNEWRAIAQVRFITPNKVESRPVVIWSDMREAKK